MPQPESSTQELSFEAALRQLEQIVAAIDEGEIGLEQSIAEYERGTKLLNHCKSILARAEARIQKLQVGPDGTVTTEPMDAPDA